MSEKYVFLFPYEKIPKGSDIVIYGAGDMGQEYLKQMMITHYCNVLFFIDRNYEKYSQMKIPTYSPYRIKEAKFDYIVIAMKTSVYLMDVVKFLKSQGVSESKVIFQGVRSKIESLFLEFSKINGEVRYRFAYEETPLSIAIKLGGNLGDAIVRKRLFCEIEKMAPEAKIDIYTPGGATYITSCYAGELGLNIVIDDGGALYEENCKRYGIAMSVSFMIRIDYIDYEKIYKINKRFADNMMLHKKRHEEYGLDLFPITQNRIHFGRALFLGRNCYTLYNYTGVFKINDQKVYIPISKEYELEYNRMNIKRYITLNFGNGSSGKGNKKSSIKQWPKEYFEEFATRFKNKYPDIKVIQIGDSSTDEIINADNRILGENIELVKYILKGAIFHLDIEGGLVHLGTQLGVKCIVLYGPTQVELYGYPQNVNIVSANCKNCHPLFSDFSICARGLERPECMLSITPDIVLEKADKVIDDALKLRELDVN
ncbi:glycosyltransferase family 9 protein [Selenomonas sp. KH1T6]|uniref:glycosyltransferase family 9 protein n=1 Tax=Selenomonas sp. KH1T6 TaxID=3158784 RepID=UPI0008A7FBD5|nr:ADP-heptose:LPS heptosyltransferase [Selenomonas ruminantium]